MDNFLTNLVIFIVMGCGWYMKRRKKLTDAGLKELNTLLFSLLMPISFFKAGLGFNAEMLSGWRYTLVIYGSYSLTLLLAWLWSGWRKVDPRRRAVTALTAIRPNTIFIGLPLMSLWLGKAGTEAQLLFVAVCTPFFNTLPLLMSQIALSGKSDFRAACMALVNTFKNPILQAGLAGILLGYFNLTPHIPQWAMRVVSVLGNCGNGLALLVIGASLAPERLKEDIKEGWMDLFIKLFLHPAVVLACFLIFPVPNPLVMKVAVVSSAVSPAFNCYVLARGMGMDGDYAAMLVASSTLLFMATALFWMDVTVRIFG